jgi:drug/metabolite transporter (DMT)-like permease
VGAKLARQQRAVSRWALLGVVIFAMTLPMTRLAVGDAAAPQLAPAFVTSRPCRRGGPLERGLPVAVRAPWPARVHWRPLAVSALGTVLGFPLFIALALRAVDAMHAAVVTGVLPLATAVVAALALRQRPSNGFWACALLGCALVLAFAAWQGGGRLVRADGWLLLAVLSAAIGYVGGAQVAAVLPAQQVICWVLVGSLPFTLPLALWLLPTEPVRGFGLAGLCLCFGVLDVAGLLCLVPRPGPGRCGAGEPGATAAALSGAAVCRAGAGRAPAPVDAVVHAGRGGRGLGGPAHAGGPPDLKET